MKNVLQYLEEKAEKYKNKIAVIEEEKQCNYTQLMENSKKIGSNICEYIEPRNPVAVLMEKGINTLYAFFGTVYAGGFYSLLNPELPEFRLENILNTLNPKIIITDEKNYELANKISKDIKVLKINEIIQTEINTEKLQEIRSNALDVDPLYVNFTSGSTGVPKGVVVSHRSVIDFIEIFTEKFDISDKDIIANQAPFDFDVSVKDIYSSLKTGATLLIVPRSYFSNPSKLLDYLCENNATTLIWAVSALCLITTFHGLEYKVPKKVNKILFSGEVMPVKHLTQWIEHLPEALFVNLYGPTEITCNCAYHIIDKKLPYEKNIPIGKAFDNEEIILLNDSNEAIYDKNKTGEICVKGSCLALGYYNNSEQTNEHFIQNPLNPYYIDMIYKTGDLGYLGEDDNLYFCGRKDFQIKHMGHRIELEEIEHEIQNVDEVERSCCIYDESKSKLYAFYIGTKEKKVLKKSLSTKLPVYMIPNIIRKVSEYPLTKNGKIDRKQILLNEKEGLYKVEENKQ